jgi:hypothetical protein
MKRYRLVARGDKSAEIHVRFDGDEDRDDLRRIAKFFIDAATDDGSGDLPEEWELIQRARRTAEKLFALTND